MFDTMKRSSAEQFELFKSECKRWIDKVGITGWDVYYEHKPLKNLAQCCTKSISHLAIITLTSEWDSEGIPCTDEGIALAAKHEVMHLLIAKLDDLASARWVTADEVTEASEELVIRLTNLIPDN